MNTKIRIIALTVVAAFAISASAQSTSKPSGNITTPANSSSKTNKAVITPETNAAEDTQSEAPVLAKRPTDPKILIPTGTAIWMNLDSSISTHYSLPGQTFTGKVKYDVVIEGKTVIPVGSRLSGRVTRLSEPRRITGRPGIMLVPDSVTLANGKSLPISAVVVDTGDPNQLSVNEEGRIKGPNFSKKDKITFAAGTAAGTIVGSVIEPGMGTLVGAGAGAAVATGNWLVRRRSLELPAGTLLIMEISNPVETPTSALPAVAEGGN
jgi:hypothetical protein